MTAQNWTSDQPPYHYAWQYGKLLHSFRFTIKFSFSNHSRYTFWSNIRQVIHFLSRTCNFRRNLTIGLPDGYILSLAKCPLVYGYILLPVKKTMWCRSLAVTHSTLNLKVGSSSDGHDGWSLKNTFLWHHFMILMC